MAGLKQFSHLRRSRTFQAYILRVLINHKAFLMSMLTVFCLSGVFLGGGGLDLVWVGFFFPDL